MNNSLYSYKVFYVFFLLLHGEQQDLLKFIEKDSWYKTNYTAPIEQLYHIYLMNLEIIQN